MGSQFYVLISLVGNECRKSNELELIGTLVSAVESGFIIDPRADVKYVDILNNPRITEALKCAEAKI